jgi:hypothetical protein
LGRASVLANGLQSLAPWRFLALNGVLYINHGWHRPVRAWRGAAKELTDSIQIVSKSVLNDGSHGFVGIDLLRLRYKYCFECF